jgi:hypothetical protein
VDVVVPPRGDEVVVPAGTDVDERGVEDVDVAVGVVVADPDVDAFGTLVVVACLVVVVRGTDRTVAAGDGFDTPWLVTDGGRTRM